MRLLLAVDHEEMQRFIMQEFRVEISEVADCEQHLYEILEYSKADTLILSRYLKGSEDPRLTVEHVRAAKPELRIVYLYGEVDTDTEVFTKYLISKSITDYHVGTNITSLEIKRLLLRDEVPAKTKIKDLFRGSTKARWYKELDSAVITIYSNSTNGKSHLAWNLATALEKRGYNTTLLNIDRGYSANLHFGIEDIYFDLLDHLISKGEHQNIIDSCYKKGKLNIITGRLGAEETINNDDFLKLLYFARSNSDIVIIDTHTGLYDTTLQAINNSNIDFLVFDSDLMHFHMNKLMLEKLGNIFIETKTFAIINNCNTGSEAYKYIYKQISKLNHRFKGVLPLSTCGSMGCDLMNTGKTPYEIGKRDSSFHLDMNNILGAINVRNNEKEKRIFNRGGR